MYGNFSNPYTNPYSAMQNRLNVMEQQYQQYSKPQITGLNGRMVTGIEEARASQIPLDGTPSYFPSPAENKIYVKLLDMNGLPIFMVYELKMPNQMEKSDLECRVEALENKLKEMLNNEPNANSAND